MSNNIMSGHEKKGAHELVRSELQLGQICFNRGDYKDAERAYRKALSIAEEAGHRDEVLSACLLNLATVLCSEDKHDEAEPLFRRLLSLDETLMGAGSTQYAMDLNNVAAHYERMGRFDEAQRFYVEAKSVFERLPNGDKDPDYALVLNNLGLLCFDQGKLTEAESFFRAALDTREAHYGSKHQYVAETLVNLAELSLQENRTEDALELFQRALAILQYTLGADHPETQEARQDYADALRQTGQPELADAIERNAIN